MPVVPERRAGRARLPAARQGGRGRRRARDARRARTRTSSTTRSAAARREAKAAFGDDRVFCERYLERPRHVEIQLLADAHGNVVALGERECSVQRRHQKVLEESPSPALDAELRARMSEAAVAFARAIGYQSAGTAEFMLDGRDFCFLELNGRIQVEHPVTELVTGLDLVAEQLRIAAGRAARRQQHVGYDGHAVEVRLYAEDPRTFLPQAGRIERLRLPDGIRVDAGVEEGDEVGIAYDPMIAKLIAHGATRDEALDRLAARARRDRGRAASSTNLPFLRWLVAHPALRAGRDDDRVPHRAPAALARRPPRLPAARGAAPGASTSPAPPPAPPPDVDAAAHAHGAGREQSALTRADAGHGDPRARRSRATASQPRQPLVVLEAMKMETPLVSPYDAVVRGGARRRGRPVAGGDAARRARGVTARRASGASSPRPCRP